MTVTSLINGVQWIFIGYFVALALIYSALNISSFLTLRQHSLRRLDVRLPGIYTDFELPVSIIAPAFNEEVTICDSVRALLQLEYTEYEVVLVNDGSSDATLEKLIDTFQFRPLPEAYRDRLRSRPVKSIYHSVLFPQLRLIDKEQGGKADALNAGLNAARYPLACIVDADSILQRNSLRLAVRPFTEDPATLAVGGTVRIAAGCTINGGFVEKIGLPRNVLALFQVVEYLRSFLYGRLGWARINGQLIISGAFGLFHKESIIAAGGYAADSIGEDMELVARLHRRVGKEAERHIIAFTPDPICWTEPPVRFRDLRNQRSRWQHGLAEVLEANRERFFHRESGAVGWLALPYYLLFELLGPIVEVVGFGLILASALLGLLDPMAFLILFFLAASVSTLLSASALLLDELSFRVYQRFRDIAVLFAASIVENVGYRQLLSFWRLTALMRWAFGAKAQWKSMKRAGFGQ